MDYTNYYPNGGYNYGYNQNYPNNGMVMSQPGQYPVPYQPQKVDPRVFDTPEITTSGSGIHFNIKDENHDTLVPVDIGPIVDDEKKKRGRPRKVETGTIIRGNESKPEKIIGTVEDTPTEYTYTETSNMLRQTLTEIDALSSELVQEFTAVKHNKFMKNKYNTLIGLSENIGTLLNTRISAIKELNSSITKSNDMDFKKMKELKAANAAMNDDKYISDIYQAFIQNKSNLQQHMQLPPMEQSTVYGSGIIRADYNPNTAPGQQDIGYMSYMANMTPEQHAMQYERNPNVQQVVVFDASTGAKYFQFMDVSTGQAIPNMPVYDQMMMEDTVLDIKNKVAKNNNLHETFPIVVINEGVTAQY